MTIHLSKGANAVISASGHDAIVIRLTWDVPEHYELDASAFMLTSNGVVPNDESMIFFNQPVSLDDAVHYHNEKQLFTLDFNKLNRQFKKLPLP